jgi:hypothetical protein
MCNAFGHLANCRCGWGRPGEVSYNNHYPEAQAARLREYAASCYAKASGAITRPNYQCKWCSAKVFFFQSADGGKVLFDSLGKPWPIHDCLGIKYERKKSKLKISPTEWVPLTNLSITPSNESEDSRFSGLLSGFDGECQYEVKISLSIENPILIKDLYLNKSDYQKSSTQMEMLIILEDGGHQFVECNLIERKPFLLNNLAEKRYFTKQTKLL